MTAPVVRRPQDVPELRTWILREWFPGRPFALSAPTHVLSAAIAPDRTTREQETEKVVLWNLIALKEAEMWFVEADMVDLIETSALTLPPTVLHDELVPFTRSQMVVLERPLQGLDAMNNAKNDVRVDGFVVGYASMMLAGPCVSMTLYSRMNFDDGLVGDDLIRTMPWLAANNDKLVLDDRSPWTREPGRVRTRTGAVHGEIWVPLGRTDWLFGKDQEYAHPQVDERTHASQIEDRRWLLALWALASEPRIAEHRTVVPDRATRRRAKREGVTSTDVTVVNLRRSLYAEAGGQRTETVSPTGKRSFHVRWTVVGHWRQQPYGPGRSLRRPTWIAPYVKGPEGAPLKKGAVVKVLRDGVEP